jgi:hypothetical protein
VATNAATVAKRTRRNALERAEGAEILIVLLLTVGNEAADRRFDI